MSEPSSAIVARISLPPTLERVRRRLDHAAGLGVPAHVTILYPWLPAGSLNRGLRATLASIVSNTPAFVVRFAAARRWPGVIYLEPDPAWRFNALIDRVVTGFPEVPPYAGAFSEVIPHLTLVENAAVQLDEIGLVATRHLPFERVVRSIEVLAEGPDGRWRTRWRLPLSADTPVRPTRRRKAAIRP